MRGSDAMSCGFPVKEACVYLVGAGPGDPGLLTVKALCLINRADVVVYDRLVSNEVMQLVPPGVSRIFVGKKTGSHSTPQDEINELLVRLARGRRKIVRLKGGDPFLFGRGGEEAEYMRQHGIDFEIVPGVTAATACAAYAGIPLTHRDLAHGVVFITGHGQAGCDMERRIIDEYHANKDSTIVIYMGLGRLQKIFQALIDSGMPDTMPVALIERGTTTAQHRVLTSAAQAYTDAVAASLEPPTMIVIGEVVRLASVLDWFIPEQSATDGQKTVSEGV